MPSRISTTWGEAALAVVSVVDPRPQALHALRTACQGLDLRHGMRDCTLYLGSRQLRMHTSTRCDFYVHTSSHPIIEHCSALRFAPYPPLPPDLATSYVTAGLQPEHNQWSLVDDFDWLKATHSPNWAELLEVERKPPAFLTGEEMEVS